jgi:hypothetical protein
MAGNVVSPRPRIARETRRATPTEIRRRSRAADHAQGDQAALGQLPPTDSPHVGHSTPQRTAGRILGEDTWRYATARFIFRPSLHLLRRLRKTTKTKTVTKAAASKTAEIFPVNYRPLRVDYGVALAGIHYDPNDVHIVVLNEENAHAVDIVATLNDALNETTAE